MPNLLAVNVRNSIIVSMICHIRENFSKTQDSIFCTLQCKAYESPQIGLYQSNTPFIIALNVLFGQHVSTRY
jgi:hypothetical protein